MSDHKRRWEHTHEESEYFSEHKKGKQDRKFAESRDRSKFKKTDRDKNLREQEMRDKIKLENEEGFLRGRVMTIASEGMMVDCRGETFTCMLRGSLKQEKTLAKNLVTVGDYVLFEKLSPTDGAITYVEPRKSTLSRADNLSQRKEQLIAANIDQVLITTSVMNPPLKPPLIDRYIIATDKGGMSPVIVINKIDLLKNPPPGEDPSFIEEEQALYPEFLKAYEIAKIPLIAVSTVTGEGLDALRAVMKDKSSVFSGQSGVGKSSLINAVSGLNLKVGETVDKTRKGSHTTSTANLLPLPFGGWCVDTPGIKSFGVWDLQKDEIQTYFEEIQEKSSECKFPNCTHLHEPGCAVEKAVKEGKISLMRYSSYLTLLEGMDKDHLRR